MNVTKLLQKSPSEIMKPVPSIFWKVPVVEVHWKYWSFPLTSLSKCRVCFKHSGCFALWILATLVVAAGFGYNFYGFVQRVIEDPSATSMIQHNPRFITLPQLGICPTPSINLSAMMEDKVVPRKYLSSIFWHMHQENYHIIGYNSVPDFEDFNNVKWSDISNMTWSSLLLRYRMKCSQFLRVCIFNYQKFNCCEFAKPVLHEKYGVCYALHKLPFQGRQSEPGGSNAGLQILAELGVVNPSISESIPYTHLEQGMVLEIAQKYQAPYSVGMHEQIRVPANVSIDLAVKMTLTKRRKHCLKGEQFRCSKQCTNLVVRRFCNCTLLGFPNTSDQYKAICDPVQMHTCYKFVAVQQSYLQMYYKCVDEACTPLCEEITYSLTPSYSSLMTDKILKFQRFTDYDANAYYNGIIVSLVKIQMYFSQLSFVEKYEYTSLTLDNILSTLGGILGLWFGFSILHISKLLLIAMGYTWPATVQAKDVGVGTETTAADKTNNNKPVVLPVLTQNRHYTAMMFPKPKELKNLRDYRRKSEAYKAC